MTTSSDASSKALRDGPEAPLVDRIRSGVYGTVIAMSVLAYLGDHDPGPGVAAATVAGTGIVIFLAEAYAELMALGLARRDRPPPREVRGTLLACSYSAAPGLVAALVLLLTTVLGLGVATRIDITLWTGVAALAVMSVLVGRGTHRRPAIRVAWTLASLAVGTSIVLLKAALH